MTTALTRFDVTFPGGAVTVETAHPELRRHLERDLAPTFQVTEPQARAPLCTARFTLDRLEYRNLAGLYRPEAARLILMHNPENNPWERRSGTVVALEDGDVFVEALNNGALIHASPSRRRATLAHSDFKRGAQEFKRFIRDQIAFPYLESRGWVAIHSALLVSPQQEGVLVVGDSGSGKTSFFMTALAQPGWWGLGSERTLIGRDGERLLATPSPEWINFLPGTLASFPQTADLVAHVPPDGHWRREHKQHVLFDEITEAFGKPPRRPTAVVSRVIVPRYSPDREPLAESAESVIRSQIFTGNETIRPNWLNWYQPDRAACAATVDALLRRPTTRIGWSGTADMVAAMEAHRAHPALVPGG